MTLEKVTLSPDEQRRRRQKSWAILAMLVAFIALVYVITIVKLTGNLS